MQVGCYNLSLYCDVQFEHEYKAFPVEYQGELGSSCRSAARKDGWILRRDGLVICPRCAAAGRKITPGYDYVGRQQEAPNA